MAIFGGIPLPRVVADTGPGGNLFTNYNAISEAALKNRQQEIANAYAPYQQYANANKTMQESQYLPYQYATQALSNPGIWMTPEGRNMAQNIIKQLPNMIPKGNNNLNMPDPSQFGNNGGLLAKIMGYANSINGSPLATNNQSVISSNANPTMSPQEVNKAANNAIANLKGLPPSTIPALAAAQQNSGGMDTSPTPMNTQADQAAAQTAAVTGQVGNQTAEQKATNDQVNTTSSGATEALKYLEAFHRNFKKSFYKGPRAGDLPVSGTGAAPTLPGGSNGPEQLADTNKNQYLNELSRIATGGDGTDLAREMTANAKGLTRTLEDDAEQELYETSKAKLQRMILTKNFHDIFFKKNPNATNEDYVAMLNNFNNNAAPYDYEKGMATPENNKLMKEYASPEALQSYRENGFYKHDQKNNSSSNNLPSESGRSNKHPQIKNGGQFIKDNNGDLYEFYDNKWHRVRT